MCLEFYNCEYPTTRYVITPSGQTLFNETYEIQAKSQPIFGLMTLLPILLSFLLTAIHWHYTEKNLKSKLLTLPLLLAQIWPQYRIGRVIYLYMKEDRRWINEKKHVERQLTSLGK